MLYIFGSIFFVVGALLNGLQIFETDSKSDAQTMLLTAMSYVIGSVLFLVPSQLYLFSFDALPDSMKVTAFAAKTYVSGSVFFFIGGAINYNRYRGACRKHAQMQSVQSSGADEPLL